MALLKFFKWIKSEKELVKKQVKSDLKGILADPTESLSVTLPMATNKEVRKVYEDTSTDEHGPYIKLTASQRLEIAKRAAGMGTTSAI